MFIITFPNNLISISSLLLCLIADIISLLLSGTFAVGFLMVIKAFVISLILRWIGRMGLGIYVFFIERKRIINISFLKKIWYILIWPVFDVIGGIAVLSALFMKVEWKSIPHTHSLSIDDITTKLN